MKNIKDLSDSNTPTVAVATAIQPITDDIATQLALTSKENLVRTAQRARKQREEVLPVSPANRSFKIPELFKNFTRFDSGQNNHERIILFGEPEMLRVLETSNFWLADGTFKVTPKMFYQLYSIYVSLSGIAPACIYAFLPNKTEKTYHRFLEALKILAPDRRPEKILLDYEQAAIQAIHKNFPESKLSGCFFNLSQSFMRIIVELGLKKDNETNHEFASAFKMLPALAFEKEEIGNSYDKIVEEIQIVCDRTIKEAEKFAKVDEICLYFGSNYIKSLVPNREALFPPSLWNQRDAASSGLARTTNAVEGWHYGIQL